MSDKIEVLAISGSLRKGSYNTAALHAAQELAPAGMKIEVADISDIPLYNADVQTQGFPKPVQELAARIRAADALLFGCPEYNYSVSGVLKNTIDWISRIEKQPFSGKPAAIVGASQGPIGTARAQYDLRKIGVFLNMPFVLQPEVMIGKAQDAFDGSGKLTNEKTRELIGKLLASLATLVKQTKS